MKPRFIKSATLVELLVCIIVLAVFVLILNIVDLFSHTHVVTSDRRAKIQNDISYVMEHHLKELSKAIGNTVIDGSANIVVTGTFYGDDRAAIKSYIDSGIQNPDGTYQPGDGQRGTSTDRWISYRVRSDTAVPTSERYQVWFCPNCTDSSCIMCNPAWGSASNVLGNRVINATYAYADNYVDISLTGCWDPQNTSDAAFGPCGASNKNPTVVMKARIKMPAVSTQ